MYRTYIPFSWRPWKERTADMNSPVRSRDAEDDIDIIIDDDEGEDAAAADAYGISWGLCNDYGIGFQHTTL